MIARSLDNATLKGAGNPLQKDRDLGGDFYTTQSPRCGHAGRAARDPVGQLGTYFVRVPAAGPAAGDENNLSGGLTRGNYRLQIRLGQVDEFPGSTVRFADIRYAANGIELLGLPAHSPLLGETAESTAANDSLATAQQLGNLLVTDRNTISVAGNLAAPSMWTGTASPSIMT